MREYTTANGDPYYPVPNQRNQKLYAGYQEMAQKESKKQRRNIHFVGRLASYKYMNMDEAIGNAFDYYNTYFSE